MKIKSNFIKNENKKKAPAKKLNQANLEIKEHAVWSVNSDLNFICPLYPQDEFLQNKRKKKLYRIHSTINGIYMLFLDSSPCKSKL